MKHWRYVGKSALLVCLLLCVNVWEVEKADSETASPPETVLAEVRALALAAKLPLSFEQITSLQSISEDASADYNSVEELNASSWDKVGNDIWNAVEQTLQGNIVSQGTWAGIQAEITSNRSQVEPYLKKTDDSLSLALDVLNDDQKAVLGVKDSQAEEEMPALLTVSKAQLQQVVTGILSVRDLSDQDFLTAREGQALSLASGLTPQGVDNSYFPQKILALMDYVRGLSQDQFQAMKADLPSEIAARLGISAPGEMQQATSDELKMSDFSDFLFNPESPRILQALFNGPSAGSQVADQDSSSTLQTSKSWYWERSLVALDCLRLVTTLSLTQEQMLAMSSSLDTLFKGKYFSDWEDLIKGKSDELAKVKKEFWAAYLSEPSSDLTGRAEKLVTSLRFPLLETSAIGPALDRLKRLLAPAQAALIDWGGASLLPTILPGPQPLNPAQQQSVANYIVQRLAHARLAVVGIRRDPRPPGPREFLQPKWRLIPILAQSLLQDLMVSRPIPPDQYPQLVSAVQDAMSQAVTMTRGQFDAQEYQLATSIMETLGLGPPPVGPPPPPPPILESEFDRIMIDPSAAMVLDVGSGGKSVQSLGLPSAGS
jgi:hypothetical protein